MNKKQKILLSTAIILLVLAADGVKSYRVARSYIAAEYPTATNIQLTRMYFIGIWMVGFNMDAWHRGAWIQVRVAPLWPATLGHSSCK